MEIEKSEEEEREGVRKYRFHTQNVTQLSNSTE
jgi:hypothetical protein